MKGWGQIQVLTAKFFKLKGKGSIRCRGEICQGLNSSVCFFLFALCFFLWLVFCVGLGSVLFASYRCSEVAAFPHAWSVDVAFLVLRLSVLVGCFCSMFLSLPVPSSCLSPSSSSFNFSLRGCFHPHVNSCLHQRLILMFISILVSVPRFPADYHLHPHLHSNLHFHSYPHHSFHLHVELELDLSFVLLPIFIFTSVSEQAGRELEEGLTSSRDTAQ